MNWYPLFGKRALDMAVGGVLLLLLLPVWVVVAGLIVCTDGGPVLFRHERIGRHGEPFVLFKFRTMRAAALGAGAAASATGFDAGDTSRVTGTGAWLRRSKLDELPQLFNVLRGDMSLVGPRPEVAGWVQPRQPQWQRVLGVRPGLTDAASIRFRHEEATLSASASPEEHYARVILPQKLAMACEYLDSVSLTADLRIIGATGVALFARQRG